MVEGELEMNLGDDFMIPVDMTLIYIVTLWRRSLIKQNEQVYEESYKNGYIGPYFDSFTQN